MNERISKHSRLTIVARARRLAAALAISGVAGMLAGCAADSATAPEMSPQQGLLGQTLGGLTNTLSSVTGLLRTTSLARPVTRSIKVRRAEGGSLYLPETGLRLTIPAGAIPRDTMTITVTALAGRLVAYEFEPHGTTFARPLEFSQQLSITSWLTSILKPGLNGGYFKDDAQLNTSTGVSTIDEEISARVIGGEVRFDIRHFSGYMVSTGRAKKGADVE